MGAIVRSRSELKLQSFEVSTVFSLRAIRETLWMASMNDFLLAGANVFQVLCLTDHRIFHYWEYTT